MGFNGTFCDLANSTSGKTTSSHIGLEIFLFLLLAIALIFCGSVARVVIKRRIERRRVVSATEGFDLEDEEIYVV